ncbi:carotenoid isomerooxygenase-like [Mytilus galloprovincialis]|uniref:carotenoid isomerooxygenase-like n=1 Tax=Mytilus galloprovincialis TaxID=29158 RepID=UPI003F7C8C5F
MEIMMIKVLLALVIIVNDILGYTENERKQFLMAGLSDIQRETIDGPVTVESGNIPTWLNGNFMRHSCGVFGETDHLDSNEPNYISHLFDCLEIGSKFKLENGHVTFTNRWYDTQSNEFYSRYGRNMNKSSVFIAGTYSKANMSQVQKFDQFGKQSNKIVEVPHVSWWQIGNQAIAMTEMPVGVVINPVKVEHNGYISYKDNNFGYGKSVQLTNNPAHEHTEADGTLWSTVTAVRFTSQTHLNIWRIIYKVGADRIRHKVGEHHYNDADLTKCSRTKPFNTYPDLSSRFGYLHSFSMTEKYIILPETAYMYDPCFYAHYQNGEPFFPQGFKFEHNGMSRLVVMRKSDGVIVASIKAKPFFVTHQLGSYEDGELIHMDMLMYDDASIYDRTTYITSLMANNPYTTNVTRITINTTDWTAMFKYLRTGPPAAFEMSNINYAYNGRKYTYAYMSRNFDRADQNAVTKLNVDTGVETEYVFPEGMFVQEPQFVSRPNSTAEDDGVILAQGVDGTKHKAFLCVIDAKTMKLISHVTAPDIALLGLHNRFFGLEVGTSTVGSGEIIGKR